MYYNGCYYSNACGNGYVSTSCNCGNSCGSNHCCYCQCCQEAFERGFQLGIAQAETENSSCGCAACGARRSYC